MTGNKIYEIRLKPLPKMSKLFFRDSWMILLTPLDDLKKTFNLKTTPKGFFPHLYNRDSNLEIQRKNLPPISDYVCGSMKPDKRTKFLDWYEQNKENPFILYKELRLYCEVVQLVLYFILPIYNINQYYFLE